MLEISSDTNDLARTERFARSAGELLETKLQGELDEPRIPGCLHLSKLIGAQFEATGSTCPASWQLFWHLGLRDSNMILNAGWLPAGDGQSEKPEALDSVS
jgi:hypothetical protein